MYASKTWTRTSYAHYLRTGDRLIRCRRSPGAQSNRWPDSRRHRQTDQETSRRARSAVSRRQRNVKTEFASQRSNYAEPSAHVGEEDEEGKYTKGRARQLISEKRAFNIPGVKKKKSTMNVRTALLYRKNFATLLEESVCHNLFLIYASDSCLCSRTSTIFLRRYRRILQPKPYRQPTRRV